MADTYASMTDLFKHEKEGIDYEIVVRDNDSDVLMTSIHGGGIEVGTTEAVECICTYGNYNVFEFKSTKPSNNSTMHVTSTHYDAPQLLGIMKETDYAISFHGAQGDDAICNMGGNDIELRNAIWSALVKKGYNVQLSPPNIVGENPDNITNRTRKSSGVQLELTTAFRQSFFKDGNTSRKARENPDNWTDFLKLFCKTIHDTVQEHLKYKSTGQTNKYIVDL